MHTFPIWILQVTNRPSPRSFSKRADRNPIQTQPKLKPDFILGLPEPRIFPSSIQSQSDISVRSGRVGLGQPGPRWTRPSIRALVWYPVTSLRKLAKPSLEAEGERWRWRWRPKEPHLSSVWASKTPSKPISETITFSKSLPGFSLCSLSEFYLLRLLFSLPFHLIWCEVVNGSQEIPSLAVSLSTNAIKFYSPETGQYFGECKGHSGTINQISFSDLLSSSSSPHIVNSCSSDGTLRFWDTRTFKQVPAKC